MPEFRDETELQDTGQDGLQRFRKPLLCRSVVRISVERVGFELDVSRLFKKYLF
jgi:hypothetical protein